MFANIEGVSSIVVFDRLVGCLGYLMPNSVYMYIHSTKDFWTNT